jgi:hypothetical protein
MTAASRGQKAAFPQLRRPPSRNFQWGRPANPQPDLDHPRQRHPTRPSVAQTRLSVPP